MCRFVVGARVVGPDRLAELIADLQHRVQARHRVLEDHRHVPAADLPQLLLGQLDQVAALEDRLAAPHAARRLRDEAEQRHRADALPRARLAHDPKRLAGIDVVRDPVDGLDDAVVRDEVDRQVANREDGLARRLALGVLRYCRHYARILRWVGSSASRRPSPMKLMHSTISVIVNPGKVTSHHIVSMFCWPSEISCPSAGVGGAMPNPR